MSIKSESIATELFLKMDEAIENKNRNTMTKFKTGQWAIYDGAYVQIEQPAYRRGLMVCRIAGSDRRRCISIKRLPPHR